MNDEDRKIILEDSEDLCVPILEILQEYFDSSKFDHKYGVIIDALAVITHSSITAMSEPTAAPQTIKNGLLEAFCGILNNLLMGQEDRWKHNEEENP